MLNAYILLDTYSAFCRRFGTWSSKAADGYHCWNEEAIAAMIDHMDDPWESFVYSSDSFQDENDGLIVDAFNQARNLSLPSLHD
jgi:hypothetical protein